MRFDDNPRLDFTERDSIVMRLRIIFLAQLGK